MGWEPQKFFVGLIDFFSVWLPGALLVYLTKDGLGLLLLGHELPISGTEGWAVFLFVSYVVGHFVFAVGSGLDKLLYDPLRAGTPGRQAARLAKGEELAPFWIRRIGSWLFERDDGPLHQILWLKDCRLARGNASAAINAFQWSKASLALRHPGALAEVERLEADSKFFRSLSVILALIGAWGVANLMAAPWLAGRSVLGLALMQPGRAAILAGGSALLLLGALARYLDRRSKAVRNAYQYLLTEAYAADAPVAAPTDDPRRLTHGGGVVVRRSGDGSIEYLRVAASDKSGRWVLPKGHIEVGESPGQTAVREVAEEAGLWARVQREICDLWCETAKGQGRVRFFLMECVETILEPKAPKRIGGLPLSPRAFGEMRRRTNWRALDAFEDLPVEQRKAVRGAAALLSGQAGSNSAGTVSSIQPPPSSRSPS